MKKYILLAFLIVSCAENEQFFVNQHKISNLVQEGMYYFWNGGDYKKAEEEFFKGITIKGNLEVVQRFFEEAVELDPKRLDIQYGLGSTYMFQKKYEEGFNVYDTILKINPKEVDAPILAAIYSYASDNVEQYDKYINTAENNDSEKTKKYIESIKRVDEVNKTELNIEPKRYTNHRIVVLGYALAEDGTMQEALIGRLEQTLKLAKLNPESKVIVSGGVPKQGQTESGLMKEWLVSNGIPSEQVLIEDRAKDTVGNGVYSMLILQELKPKYVTVISSASHMRRALNVFETIDREAGLGAVQPY